MLKPYYKTELGTLYLGDCNEILKEIADESIDLIVTDPPYGLTSIVKRFGGKDSAPAQEGTDGRFSRLSKGFMGQQWDGSGVEYNIDMWKKCLRILKPGAYLFSFAGTRTYHRITSAIDDAGFEIRDMVAWVYGSGFPKSLDVSKAIDKSMGAERQQRNGTMSADGTPGWVTSGSKEKCAICGKQYFSGNPCRCPKPDKIPITDEAKEWSGWGTSLKPALEPIAVARKPLIGTVAENALKYGTGGLNIDECRIEYEEGGNIASNPLMRKTSGSKINYGNDAESSSFKLKKEAGEMNINPSGRFPANFIHDGSPEVLKQFPDEVGGGHWAKTKVTGFGEFGGGKAEYFGVGEKDGFGSAARFFYCAKASSAERKEENKHPTVKPISLMEYLLKLASRKDAIVLDPFFGSGTTGIACERLHRKWIGIEISKDYCDMAIVRLERWKGQKRFDFADTTDVGQQKLFDEQQE